MFSLNSLWIGFIMTCLIMSAVQSADEDAVQGSKVDAVQGTNVDAVQGDNEDDVQDANEDDVQGAIKDDVQGDNEDDVQGANEDAVQDTNMDAVQGNDQDSRFVNPDESGAYFEGDMKINEGGMNMNVNRMKWPGGIVYYSFSPNFGSTDMNRVKSAMNSISTATENCITFKKRTYERDYIVFSNYLPYVCWSDFGKKGGMQTINLSSNCVKKGAIIHLIMHALGFYHEHNKPDRDKYITIHYENIWPKEVSAFRKMSTYPQYPNQVYDYNSIMHFSQNEYSINGKRTITTKDPYYQNKIGQRKEMSSGDISKIIQMYKCPTSKINRSISPQ